MNDSARPLLCLSASDVEATGLDKLRGGYDDED